MTEIFIVPGPRKRRRTESHSIVLVLPSCSHLARTLHAKRINVGSFPDGERHVFVPANVRGKRVVLVGNTGPDADALIDMVFACSTLKELGASVTLLIPYFAYARQDHPKDGEAHAASAVCDAIRKARPDKVAIIDPHGDAVVKMLDATRVDLLLGAATLVCRGLHKPVIVAPDKGAESTALIISHALKAPLVVLDKKRLTESKVRTGPVRRRLNGSTAIIVDDIVSTGATLAAAATKARDAGAARVIAIVAHNVAGRSLAKKVASMKIDRLFVMDTLPFFRAAQVVLVPAMRAVNERSISPQLI